MRVRLAVPAVALVAVLGTAAALGTAAVPGAATAAPVRNHHLTIAAIPNPVIAGEGVVIYGRLRGQPNGDQPIALYHHLAGSGRGYTLVARTTTDSAGFYEFVRAEGVVYTNRSWFVRGPDGAHSRAVYERVSALVSISASADSTDTATPVTFSGTVTPDHAFERVLLQEQQAGSGYGWHTLATGRLDSGSAYSIPYRWRRPGVHDVRVLFRGDRRDIRGCSDTVTVIVQQAQAPGFTINSSSPIAPEGSAVTISGTLDQPGSTAPEPDAVVQLWGRPATYGHFVVLADGTTGANGGYSFTQAPTVNTAYFVATPSLGHLRRRRTALLFQGARDVVTLTSSTGGASTGQTVTLTGTVLPDKAGDPVYLQRLGRDGHWHTIAVGTVRFDSTFRFERTIGAPGTRELRARVPSDGVNVGAASAPVTITVTAPPPSSLPPAP